MAWSSGETGDSGDPDGAPYEPATSFEVYDLEHRTVRRIDSDVLPVGSVALGGDLLVFIELIEEGGDTGDIRWAWLPDPGEP